MIACHVIKHVYTLLMLFLYTILLSRSLFSLLMIFFTHCLFSSNLFLFDRCAVSPYIFYVHHTFSTGKEEEHNFIQHTEV